ncbi:hypothetical protein CKM354_000061500 [Cercospora kikuchii]|uniref:Las1-domain-containing protein n=1 Tax=Cercospora kikuchii TaxID=84275 RepID=A0A9P3FB54_9PEZI|nr:rRNA-processing protein LAS1 [Cercospora kikuchii]GIZ37157.1 hypothetical protein CKM354_000061500 [Cercospora kikuchii]
MVRPTITPWRTQADLLAVRSQIYSDSPEDRQHAVSRIMAWKMRGNLPHSVESTALLVDAILHHNNSDSSTDSFFSNRAVYSAAFTRFVTGFCDIGRNKERSLEPSSMLAIAKQIGMPSEFVTLRHEATHDELPAIQRLVKAVDDALAWLWVFYWSKLEEPGTEASVAKSLPEVKARAKEIFKTYRGSRREVLKSKKPRDQTEETRATSRNLVRLVKGSRLKRKAVAETLVEENLLIPSKRGLGTPLDGAYLMWDSLLRDIVASSPSFLPVLQQSMLAILTHQEMEGTEQDATREAICMWLLHMTDYNASAEQQTAYRREMITMCCMHLGYWLTWLGKRLLETSGSDFRTDYQDLFEASRDEHAAAEGAKEDTIMHDDIAGRDAIGDVSAGGFDQSTGWERALPPIAVPIGVVEAH